MDEHARALADAVEGALGGWVERSVRSRLPDPPDPAVLVEAGKRAVAEVMPALRALLATDIDDQRTTPLTLLRAAVRYPSEVLHEAGVPPVPRDSVQQRLFPDDPYDLTPATLADIDPALTEPGIVWGAAKAFEHKRRHGAVS